MPLRSLAWLLPSPPMLPGPTHPAWPGPRR